MYLWVGVAVAAPSPGVHAVHLLMLIEDVCPTNTGYDSSEHSRSDRRLVPEGLVAVSWTYPDVSGRGRTYPDLSGRLP